MSRASKSVNAAYIRSALEVKAQRDELLAALVQIKRLSSLTGIRRTASKAIASTKKETK